MYCAARQAPPVVIKPGPYFVSAGCLPRPDFATAAPGNHRPRPASAPGAVLPALDCRSDGAVALVGGVDHVLEPPERGVDQLERAPGAQVVRRDRAPQRLDRRLDRRQRSLEGM